MVSCDGCGNGRPAVRGAQTDVGQEGGKEHGPAVGGRAALTRLWTEPASLARTGPGGDNLAVDENLLG